MPSEDEALTICRVQIALAGFEVAERFAGYWGEWFVQLWTDTMGVTGCGRSKLEAYRDAMKQAGI